MPEVVSDVRGQDDVLHLVQDGFVVGRTEVLKHVTALRVEDAQCLREVMSLHGVCVCVCACVHVCMCANSFQLISNLLPP